MTGLELRFLGTFQVTRDGVPVTRFRGDKVRALLAFLATEADRPHARATLTALLWPDQAEDAARRNFRQTLLRLREALGDTGPQSALLDITRAAIQWCGAGADVLEFGRLARSGTPDDHARAAALYRGEFLPGFALPDCTEFEEWLLLTREHYRQQALHILQRLADQQLAAGNWADAAATARRQLALDPWREAAHRQLIAALAESGDRAMALQQFATCRAVLVDELGVEPDAETQALYQRVLAGERLPPSPAAPPSDVVAHRPGLPAPLTAIVGRDADLAALAALQETGGRLITLVGAGGMGKTRLALEAARAGQARYADGVSFVALAPLTSAIALPSAIAAAVGVTLHGGDTTAALLRSLRDKHILLILDNFEHLLNGVGLVAAILEAAPRVWIIATSRERLNVRGEQVYEVEGLPYEEGATNADTAPALRLFIQSARRAQPGFAPSAADLPALRQICVLAEGMPLALELAAAWVTLLPLEEIAHEIARGTDFLQADWPDAPARQRSMRAVFDWSWCLLSDAERQVLRQLSIFRGGFTREAAEAVAGATLQTLASLRHKSLLHWRPASGNAGRYELHELLRQFAAEQLDALPDERVAVAARHGAYYLDYVAARGRRLGRDEPREAAAEIRAEIDNVRQAWDWGVDELRVAELARAAYGWWQFCLLAGHYPESRRTFALAAARLRAAYLATSDPVAAPAPPPGTSALLAINANHLWSFVPFEEMAAEARDAILLAIAGGDLEGEILGTFVLGRAYQELRRHAEARALWERTRELARAYQPRLPHSELLHEMDVLACAWLIGVSLFFGDYPAGRAWAEEQVRVARALGKRRALVSGLSSLADIDAYTGNDSAAREGLEQALPLARALDDRWREMALQRELGEVLHLQGAYTQARAAFLAAEAMARTMGSVYDSIRIVAGLVRLDCQLGDLVSASHWRDALVTLLDGPGVTLDCQAEALRACAVLKVYQGAYRWALADAERAWRASMEIDIPNYRADSWVVLGHARAAMSRPADATAAYQEAVTLYLTIGNLPLANEPRAGLAQLALARGDRIVALSLIDALLPIQAEVPRARVFTPFYADVVTYRVLTAVGDPRAGSALRAAQARLQTSAAQIADPSLRQAFLQQVAVHQELLAAETNSVGREEVPG